MDPQQTPPGGADGPAASAGDASSSPGPLALEELRIIAAGAARLVWWWPGIVVVVAVYVIVAVSLYHHSYPNLWGGLAAAVAALGWYASPLREVEARRRKRRSDARPG